MSKKQFRHLFMSVEGVNCETLYFKHVAKLITESDSAKYGLKLDPRVARPLDFAKRNHFKPRDSYKHRPLPYIHIQDIEDYYDEEQKAKFYGIIDEMRDVKEQFNISYEFGYSNYTFELWLLLHVADMNYAVSDRYAYLEKINKWFGRHFQSLEEYKKENEFQSILDEFVTLDSVFNAIERAEIIVQKNEDNKNVRENYRNFTFYHDNPDISVHNVVKLMFEICAVKRQ